MSSATRWVRLPIAVALIMIASGLSLITAAVVSAPATAAAAYRILVTGDSITQGSSGDYTWRYRLWNKLQSTAPGNVEFVGTRTDLYNNVADTFGSQYYAVPFAGSAHGAKWGGSFANDGAAIASQVSTSNANVLVEMLGSNDLAYLTSPAQTIAALQTYIGQARSARPGIDIVVAEVVNRWDPFSQTYTLNAESADYATRLGQLASALNTANERVVVAHTRTGWDAAQHAYDGTHPNPTGEAIIAQRVSEALAQISVGAASPDISGPKDWNINGPSVGLSPGVEEASLSWNRTPSGASGMYIETRLVNVNEPWHRLPYAVGGNGWTSTGLVAEGTYQYRVVPSKGTSTGLAGIAATTTVASRPIGNIANLEVGSGGDSPYGGKSAPAAWSAATNASGYFLSTKSMVNGDPNQEPWSELPYAISDTNWNFTGQPQGYRRNFGIIPNRGFARGTRRQSGAVRMRGVPVDRNYVALGDSYSSGLGSENPSDSGACKRSTGSWVYQFQPGFNRDIAHLACAGATSNDVISSQLNAMDAWFATHTGRPQLVTMTVGGNDIGFADLAARCITSSCTAEESGKTSEINALQPKLRSLYQNIKSRQPYADLLVGGYPGVIEPGGGSLNPGCLRFAEDERLMANRLVVQLNTQIQSAAIGVGAWSASMNIRNRFIGHNACTSGSPWVHGTEIGSGSGVPLVSAKSFHPNDAGQIGYALSFSDEYVYFAG